MSQDLDLYLKNTIPFVDKALDRLLPSKKATPKRLHEAIRYSVFAGGKRLRPLLVITTAEACGGRAKDVLPGACAMEMIHTYSLIHDDLPSMDDDDLRRGRPTNHKVYGEALAILAGDALLTHAFSLLSKNGRTLNLSSKNMSDLIETTVRGAGTEGMIGGQVADIESEDGRWKSREKRFEKMKPEALLRHIHLRKTAALIIASLEVGAILARGSSARRAALRRYGRALGLAFQVKDDILDRIGDKKKLGKKGSDEANNKLTFPALYGLASSQIMLKKLIKDAHQALQPFGKKAPVLHALADFVGDRDR